MTEQENKQINFQMVLPVNFLARKGEDQVPDGIGKCQKIFVLTDEQSAAMRGFMDNLHGSFGLSMNEALSLTSKTVLQLISGRKVNTTAPSAIAWLARFFPPLTSAQIHAMPTLTVPERIDFVVIHCEHEDTKEVMHKVFRFDQEQADFVAEILKEMRDGGVPAMAALNSMVKLVTGLLDGDDLGELDPNKPEEMMLIRAVGMFHGMTDEQRMAMPDATDEEMKTFAGYFGDNACLHTVGRK